jgi:hypothetical protein
MFIRYVVSNNGYSAKQILIISYQYFSEGQCANTTTQNRLYYYYYYILL